MAVTELAFVHTTSRCDPHPLKPILTESNEIVNAWASTKPDLDFEGGWQFQQIQDPSALLFTAKWNDTQAHWQWLAAEQTGPITSRILPFVAQDDDGKPNIEMWHVDADVFGSCSQNEGEIALLDSPVLSVNQHVVPAEKKAAFEKRFNEIKGLFYIEEFARPYAVRGAWKIEDDESEDANWVVFAGWPSVERHMDFEKDETFVAYRDLMDFFVRFEVGYYRRSV